MATAHNAANKGEIAKTVLMPGDPLRAKFIAETFLEDIKEFNTVRNMFGYTGTYKGKEVSVMGSGMGMPSIGIYSYELYNDYGVESIIRVGSAGSYSEDFEVYDVIIVDKAWTDSSFAKVQSGVTKTTLSGSSELNDLMDQAAKELNVPVKHGTIHSSDVFYRHAKEDYWKDILKEHNAKAVEMESFALFHNANELDKKATCILTISDSFVTNEETTAKERQESFTNMMKIALEAAIK